MTEPAPDIYVIDDDAAVREGLDNLFRSVGYATYCFPSADDFIAHERADRPACLVLDVRMPGRSGLDFQRDLRMRKDAIPIVFLTGHGDVPMSVRAMKEGAVEFLLKPFREQELLDAVQSGVALDSMRRKDVAAVADILECYRTLSNREREVLQMVAGGRSNKEIGQHFNLKEITIKVDRSRAMKKLGSSSIVDLIRKLSLIRNLNDSTE